MTLRKLEALIESARAASPRPWYAEPDGLEHDIYSNAYPGEFLASTYTDDFDSNDNAAYIVAAANAAEDMARLLMQAHSLLNRVTMYAPLDEDNDSDEVEDLIYRIEQCFGGEV